MTITTKIGIALFLLGVFALAFIISAIVVFGSMYGFHPDPVTFN